MDESDLVLVVGTRPEIIKVAPIIQQLQSRGRPFTFVLSGQHYDFNLSRQFIEQLRLPEPDVNISLEGCSNSSLQVARIFKQLNRIISERTRIIVVQGDTYTALAGTIAALSRGVEVAHVEAGLRSYDPRMPEEHNRRIVDHISGILFAPTRLTAANLKRESVRGRIYVTGNTIVDAMKQYLPAAERWSTILDQVKFREFILATAHRAENVDDPKVLANFVGVFEESSLPIVFPVHPRTYKNLNRYGLLDRLANNGSKVQLFPPLGYFDFLILMKHCTLILTDSGGLQEEATVPGIQKHIVVMRASTERPEAVRSGYSVVAGVAKERILSAVRLILDGKIRHNGVSPFGDGEAGLRIVDILDREVPRIQDVSVAQCRAS